MKNAYLITYAVFRLWVYDLQEWTKSKFIAQDEKKATETLGKVISWIIATGVVFIAFGTIKGLMTR